MKETVAAGRRGADSSVKILVGGGPVDDDDAKYAAPTAMSDFGEGATFREKR